MAVWYNCSKSDIFIYFGHLWAYWNPQNYIPHQESLCKNFFRIGQIEIKYNSDLADIRILK